MSPADKNVRLTISRRRFLHAAAASTLPLFAIRRGLASPNAKLNIAAVGTGGKGWSDLIETSVGQNVVALCDVDENNLARAAERFPGAKLYRDWRRMMEQSDIDAVTVSTPDHMHAPVAMTAIRLGRHVYCQKPLTHSVHEARRLAEAAADAGVVTQMGTQHHSNHFFKTSVRLIREGVIGRVRAAHVWTDRPVGFWPQGMDRPAGSDPVPNSLHWYEWLGVAPDRPYVHGAYHTFKWRGFWDFGTGALGDMGCHGIDPVWNALRLGPPSEVEASGPEPNPETGPTTSRVRYTFPGTDHTTPEFHLHWYDGNLRPERDVFQAPADFAVPANGILFVGTEGTLFTAYEDGPHLFPKSRFQDYRFEREPADNHYQQWTRACLGDGATSCPFSYAGPLTEMVLLGNVAYRVGRPVLWDSGAIKARGLPEADAFLRRDYRKGWEVEGLS